MLKILCFLLGVVWFVIVVVVVHFICFVFLFFSVARLAVAFSATFAWADFHSNFWSLLYS